MTKILLTGDWHLGINRLSISSKTPFSSRTNDSIEGIKKIAKISRDEKVDYSIIAGDLFDKSNPRSHLIDICSVLLLTFYGKRIVIPGNHDPAPFKRQDEYVIGPVGLACQNIHDIIYTEHKNLTIDHEYSEAAFHLRPYTRKVETLEPCERIEGKSNIVVCHHHFSGAVQGSEEFMIAGGIGESDTNNINADLILSGHIHKNQEIKYANGATVLYPGSPAKFDFGERNDDKGCYIITVEGGKISWEFRSIEGRPMIQVEIDDSFFKQTDQECIDYLLSFGVKNADVKTKINTECKLSVDVARYTRLLNKCEPYYALPPNLEEKKESSNKQKYDMSKAHKAHDELYSAWVDNNVDRFEQRKRVKQKGMDIIRRFE